MEIAAMALGLMVLTLVAACLLWFLLRHFDELYPADTDGTLHPRRAALLFRTLAGLATIGILAVLLLAVQQLGTS